MFRSPSVGRGIVAALGFALLAGCGGGPSGSLPRSLAAQGRVHGALGSTGDLIYITTSHGMLLVSYPDWKIVATVAGDWSNDALCSDPNNGNIFVTPEEFAQPQEILEFAHGGTAPIATIAVPSGYTNLFGCSVDPTTGNLAVAATQGGYKNGALLVYQGAQGAPTVYTGKTVRMFASPTYDSSGDVFVQITTKNIGFKLAELPLGKKRVVSIRLTEQLPITANLHWDGQYVVEEVWNGKGQPSTLYQVQVAGNTGTVVGAKQVRHGGSPAIAIQNGLMFGFDGQIKRQHNHAVAVWSYPTLGEPKSKFYGFAEGHQDYINELAVSVAP